MLLSDGTYYANGFIPEQIFDKQTTQINRFDVVRVTAIKKSLVKDQMILIIAAPLQVLVGNLESVLGDPKNINAASESDVIAQVEIPEPKLLGKIKSEEPPQSLKV